MKEIINHYTKYIKEFKEPMKIIKEIVKKEKKEDECCYLDQLEINNEYGIEDMNLLKKEMKLLETIPLSIKRIFNISTMNNHTMFIASRWFETIEDYINLETSTPKYLGNMTKFFYNPIPLTIQTREFFDHLRTLLFILKMIYYLKKIKEYFNENII